MYEVNVVVTVLHLLLYIHVQGYCDELCSCYVHSVFVGSSDIFVLYRVEEAYTHPNTNESSFTAPWP